MPEPRDRPKIGPMRRAVGLVMMFVGISWFLIGTNLISGSQFSGSTPGAILGAIIASAGVLVMQWRRKPSGS